MNLMKNGVVTCTKNQFASIIGEREVELLHDSTSGKKPTSFQDAARGKIEIRAEQR